MNYRNAFICGHPRASSTHLYHSLRLHPEFLNENLFDKESKFFFSVVGRRFWGLDMASALPDLAVRKQVDDEYVNRLLKTTHAFVSEYFGGKNGRFLNAFPADVDCIDRIYRADPSSKFVVLLREPVGNVWSRLNYKRTRDWIPNTKPDDAFFHKDDIWTNALSWSIPIWITAQLCTNLDLSKAILIVRHEEIVDDGYNVLKKIYNHFEIEPYDFTEARFLAHEGMENTQIHSSHFDPEGDVGVDLHQRQKSEYKKALEHPHMIEAIQYYLDLTKKPREFLGLDWRLLMPAEKL